MTIKKIDIPKLPEGSVAIIANFYASLFGGPLSQLLKCLTAVKVCAEFEEKGVSAVPVCLVNQNVPPGFSKFEINFIDRGSKIHCLKSYGKEEDSRGAFIGCKSTEKLFEEVENIFPDGDRDALSALKDAFVHDTDFVSSCARWVKYMFKEFGALVIEHDALPQCLTLPVAALVMDSAEIAEYGKDVSPWKRDDIPRPIVRPLPDVTISNARSLKTLKRYGLDLSRVFDGKAHAMDYVRKTLESDVPACLQKLRDETSAILDELETAAFSAHGELSIQISKARAARIIYQLDKIQKHSRAAIADKQKAAENRINKACDFLTPFGRRQQDTMGGAQFPLLYGMAGLRALYERLDITTPDHQLIEMD